MKIKFVKVAFVAAIVLVSGSNVFNAQNSETLSDVALANVEALANNEDTGPGSPCYKGDYDSNLPEATKCDHPCTKQRCGGEVDKCY